jgi:GTPase
MSTTSSQTANEDGKSQPVSRLQTVTVLVAGPVSSSKSTSIGVLVKGQLDTPERPMWMEVDKHRHEHESKNTSSISSHFMQRDNRVVELINLCGHLKYLKQTLLGMTGQGADYALLMVNITDGLGEASKRGGDEITDMGLEHLTALIHLEIPFMIVLTKLDSMTEVKVLMEAHRQIHDVLRENDRKAISLKLDKSYRLKEGYMAYAELISHDPSIVPVLCTSNRTGLNMDALRDLLFALRPRPLWKLEDLTSDVFYITSVYRLPHFGIIVAGDAKSRIPVRVGDTWYAGPHTVGRTTSFVSAKIRSIHNNDTRDDHKEVTELLPGESGCLCLRWTEDELKREDIRKGMILTRDPETIRASVVSQFIARVMVLQHHTSISHETQFVVHAGKIRQAAKVLMDDEDNKTDATGSKEEDKPKNIPKPIKVLRLGDVATVQFQWLFRPEYLEVGTKFLARESRCRLIGEVINPDSAKTSQADSRST